MGRDRLNNLIQEVLQGEYERDILPNSSYELSEERQAVYFSRTRNNMESDLAYHVMHHGQQLDDLKVIEVLGSHE